MDDEIRFDVQNNNTVPSTGKVHKKSALTINHRKSSLTENESQQLDHYLHAATSNNTRRTYRSAIRQFQTWGGLLPTDRDTVIRYLLDKAESLNTRSIDLHITALRQWHESQGFADPTRDALVKKTLIGIRRTHGKPKIKARPLHLQDVQKLFSEFENQQDSKRKWRDLALIMVGYFGALRRSELVALRIKNLQWEPEGLIINITKSKTDQQGEGLSRALPYGRGLICPVSILKKWIAAAEIHSGPVFRAVNRWDQVQASPLDAGSVNTIIKKLVSRTGIGFSWEFSGHSLRRGLATAAAREDVEFAAIKQQGGWKSDNTVWQYIEQGQIFENNAAKALLQKINQRDV